MCIKGCIDMFSSLIIWLHVGRSNNNRRSLAGSTVEALTSLKAPHSKRSDVGTENRYIAEMK